MCHRLFMCVYICIYIYVHTYTHRYYRGAHGCVIAFSTVDRDSFDAVEKWKSKVEAEVRLCICTFT